jgi:hypothetical protein
MSGIDLSMTSDREAVADSGKMIPAGTRVEYVCHVGWPIKVRLADGSEEIVNPHVFPTMRPGKKEDRK